METGKEGVKYGLELRKPPSKTLSQPKKKNNVFGDEDSEDELTVEEEIARHAARKQADKKTQDMIAAAVAEDTSVFDYDSHFDAIQHTREEPKRQEKLQRQSKYVGALLEKAEERKREQEILTERRLAKERKAEDHLFGDKEKFITVAYKKKLEEEKKWKDEQAQKQAEEEMNAADKKGHMGDFYRNLLRNNVAFGTSIGSDGILKKEKEHIDGCKMKEAAADGKGVEKEKEEKSEQVVTHPPLPPQQLSHLDITKTGAASTSKHEADGERAALEEIQREGSLPVPSTSGGVVVQQKSPAGDVKKDKEEAIAAARERYLARKRKLEGH
jgi:coiled-coil domain-containing protein 55